MTLDSTTTADSPGLPTTTSDDNKPDRDLQDWASRIDRVARHAARDAMMASRADGVPLVHTIEGKLHWEMPDGSLSPTDPWHGKRTPPPGWPPGPHLPLDRPVDPANLVDPAKYPMCFPAA